jgi:hypothetical protein
VFWESGRFAAGALMIAARWALKRDGKRNPISKAA